MYKQREQLGECFYAVPTVVGARGGREAIYVFYTGDVQRKTKVVCHQSSSVEAGILIYNRNLN